jgi:hypothetical protein
MQRSERRGSSMAAGLVGLVVSAVYLAAWYQLVERSTCEGTGLFDCAGPAFLMLLVGVPMSYVFLSLGLRATGAPQPWLAPLVVAAAVVVLARFSSVVDLPLWLWPAVVAVLCALWTIATNRAGSSADRPAH